MKPTGCGNGRHMVLNPNITMVGCDVSTGLAEFARSKGLEVLVGDALVLPHRTGFFDFVTCIAVIHHFSTEFHRVRLIKELVRIVKVTARSERLSDDRVGRGPGDALCVGPRTGR